VIDSDYRGPVGLPLHNDTDEVRVVKPGDRVAQMVIQEAFGVILEEAEELSETERGSGGFGSTGR
jgi:dUTP pyrophosphatase